MATIRTTRPGEQSQRFPWGEALLITLLCMAAVFLARPFFRRSHLRIENVSQPELAIALEVARSQHLSMLDRSPRVIQIESAGSSDPAQLVDLTVESQTAEGASETPRPRHLRLPNVSLGDTLQLQIDQQGRLSGPETLRVRDRRRGADTYVRIETYGAGIQVATE